jgi:prophage antirepressor-like protein
MSSASNLTTFIFENHKVRVLILDGELWFIAADVCKVLGILNYSDAYKRLREYEIKTIDSIEGVDVPIQNVVSESGLYRLVLTSRKPQAEPFQDWICQEVIPSVRKTGTYSVKPLSPAELIIAQGQALLAIEQKQAQLENEQALLRTQVSLEAQRTNDLEDLVTQHDAELDRIFNSNGHYFTIMGYCALKGKPIAVKAASQLGKKATKLCKQQGLQVAPVKDPRFGKVNSYPESVLAQII